MKYSKSIHLDSRSKKLISASWSPIIDIIPKDLYSKYEKLYQKFKDNKLKYNTTVYLTPLSLFPSYKLKNYIEENNLNIKTARKIENLNTLIVNDNFIKEGYFTEIINEEITKYYTIPYNVIANDFSTFIDTNKDSYNNILKIPSHHLSKKDKKDENLRPKCFIISEENLTKAIKHNKSFSVLLNYPSTTGELLSNFHGNRKICDNLEFFYNMFNLIEKYNLDVVFDDNINSETNKDTIVDLEMFQTLYGMLASTDKSNWSIAREIIANCDFESSKPYVLFLVSTFDFLKNKGDNKNYQIIHEHLQKLGKKISGFMYKNNNYEDFIKQIINVFPQYKQIMCDCLTTHLNHLFKISIIKAIHSL
jgi:hypothetical protein